ncbi:MAG TPA: hypothetical protein VFG25_08115 [Nitrosopumilaceae archaeon]|nr:hypothetical protein [Nitrosopumilaceae archaeon]
MQRTGFFLLIVGVLIIVGMALSFYGSQIITEDLVTEQTNLISGGEFEVFAELDPTISEDGVYVVQSTNFEENAIHVKISDPFGSQLISKTIPTESFEERFEILTKGEYQVMIENFGMQETTVFLAIGHLPDTSKLSVGITGFYILIVGMIGIAGLVILAIKNRRKNRSS